MFMSAESKIEDERVRERQTDREAKRNRESRKEIGVSAQRMEPCREDSTNAIREEEGKERAGSSRPRQEMNAKRQRDRHTAIQTDTHE